MTWDPAKTPWCPDHWSHVTSNAQAATALLITSFGQQLAADGVTATPETFLDHIAAHAPLCCFLGEQAMETIYQTLTRGPLPVEYE